MQTFNRDLGIKLERPLSVVHIPSKGRYYPEGKPSFFVRHLSYIEESALTNPDISNSEEGIKMVMRNLIIDDFNIDLLMAGDVQAISMFLRSTAFGDKINMEVKCPHCSMEDTKAMQISEFKMKEISVWPDENRFLRGELPISKWTFSLRIPTFFEEFRFKLENDNQENYLKRLSFLIKELNKTSDPIEIEQMIMSMPIRDSRFLRKFIESNTPGVDTKTMHECQGCHEEFDIHVGSGHNFLELPESYATNILEEVYAIARYGDSIGWEAATKMSTSQRKWVITRIQKDNQERNERESKAASPQKGRTRSFKNG